MTPILLPATSAFAHVQGLRLWCWRVLLAMLTCASGAFSAPLAAQQAVPDSLLGEGVQQVAAGYKHTCALTSAGAVQCWGDNRAGQLGNRTTGDTSIPVVVSGLGSGVVSLAAGYNHTCALTSAGAVQCWGGNSEGQLGNSTTSRSLTPVAVSGLGSGVVSLAAGSDHTCALTSVGAVQCWGDNSYGQLGNGTTSGSSTPVAVSSLGSGVVSLAAGGEHTCALTSAGAVQCWGDNRAGQLGNGTPSSSSTPVAVSGLGSGVVLLAAGYSHTCALTSVEVVQCWGYNSFGQLGNGTTRSSSTPVAVSGLGSGVVSLAVGGEHTCTLTSAGAVQCWGLNLYGQLGNGTTSSSSTPVSVSGLGSGVVSLAAGHFHACALTSVGAVQCWGENSYGQLGNGRASDSSIPVAVSGLGNRPSILVAGDEHTCALTTAGGVVCWGGNGSGQLGDGTRTSRSVPTPVSGLQNGVVYLAAGSYHTCAVTNAGALKCWGRNDHGQLGKGTSGTDPRDTIPTTVTRLGSGVTSVAAGGYHTCALTTSRTVQCWGSNGSGQLGDGTNNSRNAPVEILALGSDVRSMTAGNYHSCAITNATGEVKCWGANGDGQLGDGTTQQSSTPITVPNISVTSLVAGQFHTCALSADAAKCWGRNIERQLGDGTTSFRSSSPVAVSGLSSGAAYLAAGGFHTCALTSAGAVKCWGSNDNGQLGIGSTLQRSTPTDVSGLGSGVESLAAGKYHTCALTNVGAVHCWGDNRNGQLGDSTTVQRTTPMRISAGQTIAFAPATAPRAGASTTLGASASSGLAVGFDTWTPDVCSIAGNILSALPGKAGFLCGVRALQPGGVVSGTARYVAAPPRVQLLSVQVNAPQAPTSLAATPGNRSIALTWAAPADDGGSPVTGYTVAGRPSGGGAAVGCTTATAGSLGCTVNSLSDGTSYTFTVTATNAVGDSPASGPTSAATLKGSQTISFTDPGSQTFGTALTLSATSSSGLQVVFSSSTTNVCTIAPGGALTFLAAGTCTVNADQAGNATFNAAVTVGRSFTVSAIAPGAPTIGTATPGNAQATVTFTPPASNGGSTITGYTVTANPGGATTTGAASPITVSGLTNGTAYTFTVTANSGGGTGASSGASNAVTPKGGQTITFNPPGDQLFGTAPTLSATADSGLVPTFTSGSPAVCSVTPAGVLTFLSVGPCTIHADQAGNSAFDAAPQVSRTFAVLAQLSVSGAVPGMAGTATATLSGGGAGCTLASGTGFADPGSTPVGYAMPHSGFAFVATGCTSGSSVTLALAYPQSLPVGVQFWKFGPATAGATTSTWFQWTGATLSADSRTVTYTVADNGIGDADGTAGTIRDPFAPVLAVGPAAGVTSIPTLSEWGLMLTSLVAAALGMLALRGRPLNPR